MSSQWSFVLLNGDITMTACKYIVRYPAGMPFDKIGTTAHSMERLLCMPVLLCLTCDDLYIRERVLFRIVCLYALTHALKH